MADPGIKKRVDRGVAWTGVASSTIALLDVVALALILRLWVSKDDYGLVSVVVTVFGALQLLAEMGLPAAIIQRDDDDPDRLSTLYWLGLIFGALLYGVVWLTAPLIAAAHGRDEVGALFRVVGVILLLRPVYTTHQAILRRELRFGELSALRIVANLLEFSAKVGTAAAGFGLWCFAAGPLMRELFYALVMPLVLRCSPCRVLHPRRAGADIRFGVRANGGEFLFQVYSNFDYQVVAFAFGPGAVGLYRAAYELVLEPVRYVSAVITVVAFPTFARLRSDSAAVIDQFVAFTRQNLVVVLTLVGVILVSADDILTVVLGREFAVAADAGRILAIVGVLRSLSHLGPPLLDGLGRPGLTLRYQATAAAVLSTLFIAFAWAGSSFLAVAAAWAVGYPVAFALLSWMVLDRMGLGALTLLRRVGRIVVWVALATGIGFAARAAVGTAGPGMRLLVVAPTVIGISLALLAAFEGLSPRAIARAFKR